VISRAARRARRNRNREGIEATARVDRRTKDLTQRLRPGEIAVIAHEDLDQLAAEDLVARGASAVINAHRSITGRYPNAGPLVLSRAGVPLIDHVGDEILERVQEGDIIRVDGATIYREEEQLGLGTLLVGEVLDRAMTEAQRSLGIELERFVRNTIEYIRTERDLVLHGAGMPTMQTPIAGRPAVVIVRGTEHRKDLAAIRGYIHDVRPVMIAVDGAADALLEDGFTPDIIIGDMDSVSTGALTCGAELVVHAYPDGRAPGMERITGLGLHAQVFASAGTSEDIALLLAFENGADLIVAVGAHDNMVEFLDKGRAGMASTFVTRLKVGPRLVDAKGVNRLYRTQVRTRDMLLLVGSAVAAMGVAAYITPATNLWVRLQLDRVAEFFRNLF
jgi:uncharacterized membrane-anchored protein